MSGISSLVLKKYNPNAGILAKIINKCLVYVQRFTKYIEINYKPLNNVE